MFLLDNARKIKEKISDKLKKKKKTDEKVSEIKTEVEEIKKVREMTEIEMRKESLNAEKVEEEESSNAEKVEEDNFPLKRMEGDKIPHTMKELEVKVKDK